MGTSPGIINHALGLHLHQPPGNMLDILKNAEFEGIGIIHAYNRIVNYALKYKDVAKIRTMLKRC